MEKLIRPQVRVQWSANPKKAGKILQSIEKQYLITEMVILSL